MEVYASVGKLQSSESIYVNQYAMTWPALSVPTTQTTAVTVPLETISFELLGFFLVCLFVCVVCICLFVFVLKLICASFSLDLVAQQLQNLINPQGLFNTSIHGYLQIRFQFIVIFPRCCCSALWFIALVKKVTCVQLFLVGSLLYSVFNHCVLCQDIDSIGDILCVVTSW